MTGPVYTEGGRLMGNIVSNVTGYLFMKRLSFRKHLLKKPAEAIAYDAIPFMEKVVPACTWLVVLDEDTDTVYRVAVKQFVDESFSLDRGHATQLALALSRWERMTLAEWKALRSA